MSWNQSVVTNAGVGLLNESLAGHTLTIESAVGGAGTLTEEELAAATDVADQKQTFALLGIEDIEGGKRVGIQITNNGVSESYILHQIGVQARLEYEEAPLTLLIILQDEHGVEIPTEAENPDWLFEIYAVISISNKANITVNIDTSAIASVSYVQQVLSNKADTDLSNLDTPQAALANLGAGVRPNLLDNPCFVGGGTGWGVFPVNQRGALSGSTDWTFLCDRWEQFGADWSLTADGLVMAKRSDADYWSFLQHIPTAVLEALAGETLTASVLFDDSLVTAAKVLTSPVTYFPFDTGERVEVIPESGVVQYYGGSVTRTVKAIKLEVGNTQTLAYQDAGGVWHLLPQPEGDYAAQLLRCQQYQFVNKTPQTNFPVVMNGNSGIATVQTPVPMGKTPVFLKDAASGYGVVWTDTSAIAVTDVSVNGCVGNFVSLNINTNSPITSNCVWRECTFTLDTGM